MTFTFSKPGQEAYEKKCLSVQHPHIHPAVNDALACIYAKEKGA